MKKFLLVLIALALLGSAAAEGFDEFTFDLYTGGARVTGYTGEGGEVYVASEIIGTTVTAIASGAFAGNADITRVILPESVAIIGDAAFLDCAGLAEVVIENPEAEIGALAFVGCSPELIICAPKASTAQTYAEEYSIAFSELPSDLSVAYAEAMTAFESGDYEAAREKFMLLGDYEDSRDYYFYCAGRGYEAEGDIQSARIIYNLIPGFLDSDTRAIESTDDTDDIDYDGLGANDDIEIGGALGLGGDTEDSAPDDGEIEIGGALGIGGETEDDVLGIGDGTETAPEIDIGGIVGTLPAAPGAPISEAQPYQTFSGRMPTRFDNYLTTENYYMIFFAVPDTSTLDKYTETLISNGWKANEMGEEDGWKYTLFTSENYDGTFYMIYNAESAEVCFSFDGGVNYGFDPMEGLD